MRFLGESLILTVISFVLAMILVELALPLLNGLFQMRLSLGLFGHGMVVAAIIGVIGITALAAGAYPALTLSRFHPVHALKGNVGPTNRRQRLRRTLVIAQFSVTIFLLLGTGTIYTQLRHMKTWDVGYDKDRIVTIPLREDSRDQFEILKAELLKNPEIVSVAGSVKALPYWYAYTTANWAGQPTDEGERVAMNFTGYDFNRTYGIEMIEGRDFSPDHPSDRLQGCVINRKLAEMMNQTPVLGATIGVWGEDRQVIGVTENFSFHNLSMEMPPLATMMVDENCWLFTKMRVLSIRLDRDNMSTAMQHVRDTWERILPNRPFDYSFVVEQLDAEYKSIEQVRSLAGCFGVLAIIIACLGLFGVASYTAEQRTKEIGIRKVLGASIPNIVNLITREFVLLVGIANVIAWPLSWLAMNLWLEDYACRAEISIGLFLVIGLSVLVIALLSSVSFQAIRAACASPVDALRYE
jgi:putative ABC transport system permease protein